MGMHVLKPNRKKTKRQHRAVRARRAAREGQVKRFKVVTESLHPLLGSLLLGLSVGNMNESQLNSSSPLFCGTHAT